MADPKKCILIVDDDASFLETLRQVLLDISPEALIVEASDGSEALSKARNQRFDLVITDLKMPKMDGKSLIQSLGLIPPEFKPATCVIFSGELTPEYARAELGGITFLSKMGPPAEFKEVVLKSLGVVSGASARPTKVDVAFINPFIEGVLSVLKMTANVEAKKENVFIRAKGQISGDVSAVIAMNSQIYSGSMAISFEKSCFLFVVSSMLGEEYREVTAEIQDAAGEICNQVFGYARKSLNEAGHTIKPAIPSIIVGDGHLIKHMVNGICIAVRFSTEKGCFTVEAILQLNDA